MKELKTLCLEQFAASVHAAARQSGFYDELEKIESCIDGCNLEGQVENDEALHEALILFWTGTRIALIHSELSEALEGIRKDLMDTHLPHRKMEVTEYADTFIRLMDLVAYRGYASIFHDVVMEKMQYNAQRGHKYGGKKL